MIYSVTINNKAIADSGLSVSLQTAYLIGGIVQMTTNWRGMTKIEHEGRIFFWLDYDKVLSELPILDLKPDSLYRALKSLAGDDGFLVAHPNNKALKKPFYALTEKCYLLFDLDNGKKSEHSEKNPNDSGKKSDTRAEKNPYNNSTKNNSIEDKYTSPNGDVPLAVSAIADTTTETIPQGEKEKVVSATVAMLFAENVGELKNIKSLPTEKAMSELMGEFGADVFWHYANAMNKHTKEVKNFASSFRNWVINKNGLCAFNAFNLFWKELKGHEFLDLMTLQKKDKIALERIGEDIRHRIAKKKNIKADKVEVADLQNAILVFFQKMPAHWYAKSQFFSLMRIYENINAIFDEIQEQAHRATAQQAPQQAAADAILTPAHREGLRKAAQANRLSQASNLYSKSHFIEKYYRIFSNMLLATNIAESEQQSYDQIKDEQLTREIMAAMPKQ